ncbi:MAG: hypothetical protein IJS74_03555 [Clostridia bacterium]|nr:hypothetical protein [Clostridia bacterium]
MKKLFVLFACVLSFLMLPVFTACGIEGSSVAKKIMFTQSVYYVDLGVKTHIDYKVYPSSAKNYSINYDLGGNDYTQQGYYNFENGWITVSDERFTELNVTIGINEDKDTAVVKLREYPNKNSIYFEATTDTISEDAYKSLKLKASFGKDENLERFLENGEYNYQLTSENTSVIQVVDSQRLLVKSTGRLGESKITVKILNSAGEEMSDLSAEVTLKVQPKIASAYVTLEDKAIANDGQYLFILSESESVQKEIQVKYFSEKGFLLDNIDYSVVSSDTAVVQVITDDSGVKLELKNQGNRGGEALITIQANGINENGLPYKITFKAVIEKNEPSS